MRMFAEPQRGSSFRGLETTELGEFTSSTSLFLTQCLQFDSPKLTGGLRQQSAKLLRQRSMHRRGDSAAVSAGHDTTSLLDSLSSLVSSRCRGDVASYAASDRTGTAGAEG